MLPFLLPYNARTLNGGRIGVRPGFHIVLHTNRPRYDSDTVGRYYDEEREAEERRQRLREAEERRQRLREAEERRQRRRDAERLRREAGEPRLCGGVIVISPASARPSASAPSSSDGRFTGYGVPHYSSSSSSSSGVRCWYYNGIEGSCFYGLRCRYIHDI